MGLKDSECGQMGVTMMAGTLGWIMEAPAAAAYAVLPVGVETITPGGERERERETFPHHHIYLLDFLQLCSSFIVHVICRDPTVKNVTFSLGRRWRQKRDIA